MVKQSGWAAGRDLDGTGRTSGAEDDVEVVVYTVFGLEGARGEHLIGLDTKSTCYRHCSESARSESMG